ncbi:hypothetical protein AB0B66_08100 [Catellatospora sp. NPDC049111]|uniref:hypothetical protein n=1 Tax=Catellatospora sp. NPDC049111 TaxID=3155271 RepID=UPI0033DDEE9D
MRPPAARAVADLFAYRNELHARREQMAAEAAQELVADLAEHTDGRPYVEVADELCARMGVRLRTWADGPVDDHVAPNTFAAAVLTAATAAVRGKLPEAGAEPDGWRGAWQVLTAVTRMVAADAAADAIAELRSLPGAEVLPELPDGPAATSPILWVRDAYGSRFGVTASFSTLGGDDRWYLWDVDACGYMPFTVHSGYYPTQEQALAAWRAGVGPMAAEAAAAPVDDPSLLAELLFPGEGLIRAGGESAEQLAEYHRGARLADAALSTLTVSPYDPAEDQAANAAREFEAWLREHRPDRLPADIDEIAAELAGSWRIDSPPALFHTCSPHRVASAVAHVRDYYEDDFAERLIDVLPDWISWLAARTGLSPDLADRCTPYVRGRRFPGTEGDGTQPNYQARVVE